MIRYRKLALALFCAALFATGCGKGAGASSAAAGAETSGAAEAKKDAETAAGSEADSAGASGESGAAVQTDAYTETKAQSETGAQASAAGSVASASDKQSTELYAMDTVMTLTAYGANAEKGLTAASDEINRLDQLFSISSENGDVYKVNHGLTKEVSADTESLIANALKYGAMTNGLFDCTIEPVMEAWGFTTKNYRVPDAQELKDKLALVDYRKVSLDGNQVTLPEGMQLDFGGIAKGFTSARVMDVFRDAGVTSAIVSLGGNVQALGTKPDGSRWRVGIQDPRDLNNNIAVVEIEDEAVITSGAYQRFFEQGGKTYHHIIDPRTGYPAESGLNSVSIITKDGTMADALSTSLFIMGADQAAEFWKQHRDKFDTVMMKDDGTVIVTAGLADRCTVLTDGPIEIVQ